MGPNYIALAVPFFFLLMGIELLVARRRKRSVYRFEDALTNVSCGVTQQIIMLFANGVLFAGYFWIYNHARLVDLGRHPAVAWIVALVGVDFIYYWWHRWRHQSNFLWRWLHQMHHSPQRIEVITSFYKHPFEILANSVLSSAILYILVGVGPEAAAGAVLLSGLAELVYHWNVRTPYWLGFVFQRPESHCVHHEKGVHSFNYSDLPLWDMLFGTFRNPRVWNGECGFEPEQENHFGDMLLGRDVNALKAGSPS